MRREFLYHGCREWVCNRLGVTFRHSNANQSSSKSQETKRLSISAIRSCAHDNSRCSKSTCDSLDLLCNCFIVKLGDIDKDFCSTFLDQFFLASMINSNNSHCHTTTSDLASQVALCMVSMRPDLSIYGVSYKTTSRTGYCMLVWRLHDTRGWPYRQQPIVHSVHHTFSRLNIWSRKVLWASLTWGWSAPEEARPIKRLNWGCENSRRDTSTQ